jgi:hypothetical protein
MSQKSLLEFSPPASNVISFNKIASLPASFSVCDADHCEHALFHIFAKLDAGDDGSAPAFWRSAGEAA